jgi:hypothetical protein
MSRFNLFLATPALITAATPDEEIDEELTRMFMRSIATQEFEQGKITESDFLEVIHHCGVDAYGLVDELEDKLNRGEI